MGFKWGSNLRQLNFGVNIILRVMDYLRLKSQFNLSGDFNLRVGFDLKINFNLEVKVDLRIGVNLRVYFDLRVDLVLIWLSLEFFYLVIAWAINWATLKSNFLPKLGLDLKVELGPFDCDLTWKLVWNLI